MYQSTKTYNHEVGLSACFRQWRAKSHCQYLHGYALAVKFVFETQTLDANGWVVDFGGLKELKEWLVDQFDHKLLVAEDDPHLPHFKNLQDCGLAQLRVVPHTGCEAFARLIYAAAADWLIKKEGIRVRLVSVQVSEHGANSAIYTPEVKWSRQ